jgi:hypothetical protein
MFKASAAQAGSQVSRNVRTAKTEMEQGTKESSERIPALKAGNWHMETRGSKLQ